MSAAEEVVRRCFAVVGDLTSSVEDLRAVIAPGAVFTEMPNPIVTLRDGLIVEHVTDDCYEPFQL